MAAKTRRFAIPGDQIADVAPGRGSCIASDRILVDNQRVGYMYREAPDQSHDSGWRFFSGTESQEYCDDAGNFSFYDVNTVANYDSSILPFLDADVGAAFERNEYGQFVAVAAPDDPGSN